MSLRSQPDFRCLVSRNGTASRAIASLELQALRTWAAAAAARTADIAERAHLAYAVQQIAELEREPHRLEAPPAEPPDGPPIGAPDADEEEP